MSLAFDGSLRRVRTMPACNSPIVTADRNNWCSSWLLSQATTPPCGRGFRSSDTTAAALATAIIAEPTRRKLERIAKDLFYPNRRYELVIKQAINEKLPGPELSHFADWLRSGAVDQKRIDALAARGGSSFVTAPRTGQQW